MPVLPDSPRGVRLPAKSRAAPQSRAAILHTRAGDHALDFEDGEVRIHVPIQTSSDIEFYLDGARLLLEEGCTYCLDVNLPHRVNNRSEPHFSTRRGSSSLEIEMKSSQRLRRLRSERLNDAQSGHYELSVSFGRQQRANALHESSFGSTLNTTASQPATS